MSTGSHHPNRRIEGHLACYKTALLCILLWVSVHSPMNQLCRGYLNVSKIGCASCLVRGLRPQNHHDGGKHFDGLSGPGMPSESDKLLISTTSRIITQYCHVFPTGIVVELFSLKENANNADDLKSIILPLTIGFKHQMHTAIPKYPSI